MPIPPVDYKSNNRIKTLLSGEKKSGGKIKTLIVVRIYSYTYEYNILVHTFLVNLRPSEVEEIFIVRVIFVKTRYR